MGLGGYNNCGLEALTVLIPLLEGWGDIYTTILRARTHGLLF